MPEIVLTGVHCLDCLANVFKIRSILQFTFFTFISGHFLPFCVKKGARNMIDFLLMDLTLGRTGLSRFKI